MNVSGTRRSGTRRVPAEEFAQVYEDHAIVVFAYLRNRLRDPELAAELTSETFARALESWQAFDGSRGTVRAWLFGIASNVAALTLRSGHRERRARDRLGVPSVDATPAEISELEDRLDAERLGHTIGSLVADLPAAEREAILARIVDEQEYTEIARDAGEEPAAIRKRVSRGLRRLYGGLDGSSR